ncbi:RNA polymerase III RPC4-domain-containing protein [Cantharellus anzutake]|uniref:RNA polymerase III RPC4-domain-containing protein n=1 Tax=Cantharellus anzutake TaxID=1750568 RepID=UPI0019044558|nr:RNA polymerase III RPC4-domain-containing protein [Cantharellus anzutake]KAF8324322.1 RNA polymerase III RPC4-domain-containing protein [Cantharellus anzutake]
MSEQSNIDASNGAGANEVPSTSAASIQNRSVTPSVRPAVRPLGSFRSTSTDALASRAIGNQGKKPDVNASGMNITRSGAPKMSFTAKVVGKRQMESPALNATQTEMKPAASSPQDGGRGRGSDRGRGRGAVPQQTVRGVFSQGPSYGTPLRHNANTTRQRGKGIDAANASAHYLKSRMGTFGRTKDEADVDQYSDDDNAGKVVDINAMNDDQDWGMPVALKRMKEEKEGDKLAKKVKVEMEEASISDLTKAPSSTKNELEVDFANALDLSESEEEERLEDFIEDFVLHPDPQNPSVDTPEDTPLYFFQFPSPFPAFIPPPVPKSPKDADVKEFESMDVDAPVDGSSAPQNGEEMKSAIDQVPPRKKSVSFAPETKPPAPSPAASTTEESPLDGVIGELLIYRSGIVKMKLGNGMVMDVTAATQPSFLQHAVYLDPSEKGGKEVDKQNTSTEFTRMTVIGEVARRFIVSPDVDAMLDELELESNKKGANVLTEQK